MEIRNLDTVEMMPVDMDGADGVRMAIMVGRQDGAPHFAMRQFEVQPGGNTPRHSHDYEHEVIIIGGSGTIHLLGKDRELRKGDVLYVPADSEHQFRADKGDPLRFICLVPVDRNCGGDTPGS